MTIVFNPDPKPPKRSKKARKPPKRRNYKRHKREWARAYHSPERVVFVALLPCVATGLLGGIDNAHVAEIGQKGASYKGGYMSIVPMRGDAHRLLHQDPQKFFATYPHLSPATLAHLALDTHALWLQHCERTIEQRVASEDRPDSIAMILSVVKEMESEEMSRRFIASLGYSPLNALARHLRRAVDQIDRERSQVEVSK